MWSISGLKQEAKELLSNRYWMTVLFCFILSFIIGFQFNTSNELRNIDLSGYDIESLEDFFYAFEDAMSSPEYVALSLFTNVLNFVASIVNLALSVFLINVFTIGGCTFFLSSRMRPTKIDAIIFGFKGNYKNVVLTMFLKDLYIWLWSLLLIIPGIIKSYEYRMVDYLLAENPHMDNKRAFELSSKMMEGEKMNAFLLDLSFIGWDLLNVCTCGILGLFFLNPYKNHTKAGLYVALRTKALEQGLTNNEELCAIINASNLEAK